MVHSITKVDKNCLIPQHNLKEIEVSPENDTTLDKCKHLDTTIYNNLCNNNENQIVSLSESGYEIDVNRFIKLAEKKAFSYGLNNDFLRYLESNKSKKHEYLIKQTNEAINCKKVYLQNGFDYFTHTCKRKTCLMCQNKKTAKLIDSYLSQLDFSKNDLYLCTFTRKDHTVKRLAKDLNIIIKVFGNIVRNTKKTYKLNVECIRSIECTHNEIKKTYHLHIHALIKGQKQAEIMHKLWSEHFNKKNKYNVNSKGQDIRLADNNSGLELFKYCTKLNDVNFEALAEILYVFQNRRLVQTYGMTKQKEIETENEKTNNISNGYKIEVYQYEPNIYNWTNAIGDCMTLYEPKPKQFKTNKYAKNSKSKRQKIKDSSNNG